MKIAITGKGGVGKTTFAATLARLYAEDNKHVLAADVDPDANLGLALGFTEEERRRPMIGIVSSFNEIVPGHMNIDKLTEAVKLQLHSARVRAKGGHDKLYRSHTSTSQIFSISSATNELCSELMGLLFCIS